LPWWLKTIGGVVGGFYTLLGIPSTGEDIAKWSPVFQWVREYLVGGTLVVVAVVACFSLLVVAQVYVAVKARTAVAPPSSGERRERRSAHSNAERTALPEPSPGELLKAAYRDGMKLRTFLVWAEGAPDSAEEEAEAERRAQDKAREWARRTWLMLLEHFPAHEREFYGPGDPALGRTGFWLSAKEEMKGRHADSYLASKLDLLQRLLPREDRPIERPSAEPRVATRGRELPVMERLADISQQPVSGPTLESLPLQLRQQSHQLSTLKSRVRSDPFGRALASPTLPGYRTQMDAVLQRVVGLLKPDHGDLVHGFLAPVPVPVAVTFLLGGGSEADQLIRELSAYEDRLTPIIVRLAAGDR